MGVGSTDVQVPRHIRTLVLSQYYDPEPIPKPSEVAEGLVDRGHRVAVITGLPNYPSGTLYPGYQLVAWMRERVRAIPVLRVLEIPYHGQSAVGRVVNYGSFMISGTVAGLLVARPDVIYVWHPPLTVAVAAAVIGALRRVPFVLDVQDIWPEAVIASGLLREGLTAKFLRRVERWVYARASRILVVTEGARRNLTAKGVPQGKVVTLPNWISVEIGASQNKDDVTAARGELQADDAFVVTFAGNLGRLQDLDTVLVAAELLRGMAPKVAIRIIGDGSERTRLEQLTRSKGLTNVRFLGPYPAALMPALFAASDALLVHLNARALDELILPTKTLSYLAAGRPIIAATGGATTELINRAGAGVGIAGGDSSALANAIIAMAARPASERHAMGERGRALVSKEFDRALLLDRLASVVREAARSR